MKKASGTIIRYKKVPDTFLFGAGFNRVDPVKSYFAGIPHFAELFNRVDKSL